jgi:hypothetical protein
VEADRRGIDLGHVKTVHDSFTELGFGTACEELVKFDEETGVWVGRFDGLG